jgi:hypothetical protein
MNKSKSSNKDSIWDVYINSYIVDANLVWSGPNAQPLPLSTPIHVITACNPFAQLLSNHENRQRNDLLLEHIEKLNLEFKPVIGRSANGDWQEQSFAIFGFSRSQACDLATAFDQRAIFELSENELLVIEANSHEVKKRRRR